MTGAVHQLMVFSDDPSGVVFIVVTAGNRARIPDLDRAGLLLPRSAAHHWEVRGHGPFRTVDDATGPDGYRSYFSGPHAPAHEGFAGFSESRAFVSAP
jgi:hypothetical protein